MGEGSDVSADDTLPPVAGQAFRSFDSGRPLPALLPSLLQLAPEKLSSMRDSLFETPVAVSTYTAIQVQLASCLSDMTVGFKEVANPALLMCRAF